MEKKEKNNYIPVYQYAKQNETSKQNVYRWIRENKFNDKDIVVEKIEVERIFINPEAKPSINNL